MNTFTIEELDREEIEFLPPRVVMCTSSCHPACCQPTVQVWINVRIGCLFGADAVVRA